MPKRDVVGGVVAFAVYGIAIAWFAFILAAIIGWVMNMVTLIGLDTSAGYDAEFVLRAVGIRHAGIQGAVKDRQARNQGVARSRAAAILP